MSAKGKATGDGADAESIEQKTNRIHKRGAHGTAIERVERDHKIVKAYARGRSIEDLGNEFDLGDRQVRDIIAQFRERTAARWSDEKAIQIVYQMLGRYEAWISQLAEVAEEATNDTAIVGAVNSQMHAQAKMAELCQATGLMPRNLGTLKVELEARAVAQRFLVVLREHEVTDEVMKDLMGVLGQPVLPAPEA